MKPVAKSVALVLLCSGLSMAQIHGIPASVTSTGPGRSSTPGIPASVTSLGPHGFSGSSNGSGIRSGIRFGQVPSFHPGFNGPRRSRAFPVAVPVYVYPYAYSDRYAYQSTVDPVYEPEVVEDPVTQADVTDASRYGDHYLDSREGSPSVRVIPAPKPYRPEAQRAEPESRPTPTPTEEPPTVLVFKDGHHVEVHNYAIIGTTLWDLGHHLTKKIALADLDLDATSKLNDERGTPFKLPKKS